MIGGWSALVLAGCLEIVWVAGFKQLGLARPALSAGVILAMIASFYFLNLAMRTLPVGTSYAVWTGIGAVGAAVIGMLVYKEPVTALRIGSIVLIIAVIAGLILSSWIYS